MAQFFTIHPENPQPRFIQEAIKIVRSGGIIVYPTDSAYAIGCQLDNKHGMDRIRRLRNLDETHNFTLICRDLSEISNYALIDDVAFRILRTHTPGPYTFILKATKEVPRRLMHPKRSTIGIRVPENKVAQALLEELNEPLMSISLVSSQSETVDLDAQEIEDEIGELVDAIIDGGVCSQIPTTIIDLVNGEAIVVRVGRGDPTDFV